MKKLFQLVLSISLLLAAIGAYPGAPPAWAAGAPPTRAAAGRSVPGPAVTGADTLADKYVPEGTPVNDISLPAKVMVSLNNKKSQAVGVKWDTSACDTGTVGTYPCKGTFVLPPGISNPKGISASIRIVVSHPINDPRPNTPLRTSAGILIEEFDSLAQWTCSKNAGISLDTQNMVSGRASLCLTALQPGTKGTDNGFEMKKVYKKPLDLSRMDNVQFELYVPDTSLVDHIALIFNSDEKALYKDCYTYWIGTWRLVNGWNRIVLLKSEFSSVKTPSWSRIGCVRAILLPKQGCKTSMNLDWLAYNVRGKPEVLFTFDDGWYDLVDPEIEDNAFSCLSSKGLKATVWAIMSASGGYLGSRHVLDSKGSPAYLNEDDLSKLYAAGWDIGNHTVSHFDDVSKLSPDQLRREYGRCQDWLLKKSWTRGAHFVCYPTGSYDEQLTEILQTLGVMAARTTVYGLQAAPADNIYKLKCIFVDDLRDKAGNPVQDARGRHVKDMAKVEKEIDKAVETGTSLIFMLHKIEDTNDRLALSTQDFKRIVDYVWSYSRQGKLKAATISEWYKDYMGK